MKGRVTFILSALALALLGGIAYAAEYPTKPITLQIPYPAGGSSDVGARIVEIGRAYV